MYLHTKKQLLYFDEVIRLHYEEGLSEDRIALRVPVGHTTVGRWLAMYQKESQAHQSPVISRLSDLDVKELHDSGMSMRAIARATGLSKSAICRRIANFAIESKEQDMPQTKTTSKPIAEQDAQARIAELEAKLQKAELARDAYNEMINVAEAKFNIPIRKKAGAKR